MFTDNMTHADIVAIGFILLGALQGIFRGLSGEMARLLGAICAFAAGGFLHEPLGLWAENHTRLEGQQARILTYILTVVAAIILWNIFNKIIRKVLQALLPKGFDRSAGVPAGMLRMTALAGIVFIAMNLSPNAPLQEQFGESSFFGRLAIKCLPTVKEKLEEHDVQPPAFPPETPSEPEPQPYEQEDIPI